MEEGAARRAMDLASVLEGATIEQLVGVQVPEHGQLTLKARVDPEGSGLLWAQLPGNPLWDGEEEKEKERRSSRFIKTRTQPGRGWE